MNFCNTPQGNLCGNGKVLPACCESDDAIILVGNG
jgi:hypothetical protein